VVTEDRKSFQPNYSVAELEAKHLLENVVSEIITKRKMSLGMIIFGGVGCAPDICAAPVVVLLNSIQFYSSLTCSASSFC